MNGNLKILSRSTSSIFPQKDHGNDTLARYLKTDIVLPPWQYPQKGVSDAKLCLEIETIIGKQSATDDRLEEIVGQTHLTKLAQERQSLSEPFLSIPQEYES